VLAKQFGYDGAHGYAAHERVDVFTIGADDVVAGFGSVQHANRNGFFAWIEVQKAADIGLTGNHRAVTECAGERRQ